MNSHGFEELRLRSAHRLALEALRVAIRPKLIAISVPFHLQAFSALLGSCVVTARTTW